MSNPLNGLLSLTRDAVGRVARALITLEGKTTTLQVKMKLRELGFDASQNEVRELMLDITSNDGDLVYEQSGDRYRIYTFRVPFPATDDLSILNALGDMTAHPGNGWHIFDYKNICGLCGLSKGAVEEFNWQCAGKKTEIGESKWKRNLHDSIVKLVSNPSSIVGMSMLGGTNPTVTNKPQDINTNTKTVHWDDIPGTYTVTDEFGYFPQTYTNVSRSQAKANWARDTQRFYYLARTKKHV